ncbi:hypothetical protein KAI52_03770 [Candidatus Parcubacteria bacterium]|nr:hypothetical protein [Candidatus Parcubacteria bacterium]
MLFAAQLAIIANAIYPLNRLQLFLSLLSAMLLFNKNDSYIWAWWIAFAVILNSYSIYPIFVIPLILTFTILISKFFFNNFFTNRSYYSLIVVCSIATIFYNVSLLWLKYIINNLYFQKMRFTLDIFFIDLLWQILFNSLAAIILFAFFKKLKYAR